MVLHFRPGRRGEVLCFFLFVLVVKVVKLPKIQFGIEDRIERDGLVAGQLVQHSLSSRKSFGDEVIDLGFARLVCPRLIGFHLHLADIRQRLEFIAEKLRFGQLGHLQITHGPVGIKYVVIDVEDRIRLDQQLRDVQRGEGFDFDGGTEQILVQFRIPPGLDRLDGEWQALVPLNEEIRVADAVHPLQDVREFGEPRLPAGIELDAEKAGQHPFITLGVVPGRGGADDLLCHVDRSNRWVMRRKPRNIVAIRRR